MKSRGNNPNLFLKSHGDLNHSSIHEVHLLGLLKVIGAGEAQTSSSATAYSRQGHLRTLHLAAKYTSTAPQPVSERSIDYQST